MTGRAITIKTLYESIRAVKRKLDELTSILVEDGELSDATLDALQKARETPEEEYVPAQRYLFTVGKQRALCLNGDLSWLWREVGGYLRVRVQI